MDFIFSDLVASDALEWYDVGMVLAELIHLWTFMSSDVDFVVERPTAQLF